MKRFIKIIEIFRYHIQISMQNIIFGHTLPLKQNQLAFFLGGGGFTCLAIPLPATSTSMLTFSDLECELVVHTICVSVTVFTSQAVPDIVTVTSDFTELKNN